MISHHLFLSLVLLLSCPSIFADNTTKTVDTQQPEQTIETLQAEITKLSDQQRELDEQKNTIQQELRKTTTQLEKTRNEQRKLNNDIIELNISIKNLTQENGQLFEQSAHLIEKNKQLGEKIARIETERRRLEDDLACIQEELSTARSREKELTHSKLTSETKAAQELHRVRRSVIELQKEIDDASCKHTTKMVTCFAAGGITMAIVMHYIVPEIT